MKLYDYYQKKSIKLLTCDEVISILEKDQNQNKYLKANKKIDLFKDDIYKIVLKNEKNNNLCNTDTNNYHSESSLFNGQEKTNATYNNTVESTSSFENFQKKNSPNKKSKIKYCFTEPNISSNVILIFKLIASRDRIPD